MQLQTTMAIIGIYKCTLHGHEIIGITTVFDDSQLLADYHWYFHACPMILSVYTTDYCLNFENKRTRTHTQARRRQFTV